MVDVQGKVIVIDEAVEQRIEQAMDRELDRAMANM